MPKPRKSGKQIKDWFMKNIILPNNEIIDKPGFIVSQYVGAKTRCYVRELLVPEMVLANLENEIVKKFDSKGKQALYSAGKYWGVRYATTTNIPPKSSMSEKDFREFIGNFVQFMQSEYATKMGYSLDYSKDLFETTYENLMVCRLSGQGYFLVGTMNGAWQHMVGKETEGVQTTCQGRGGSQCTIRCGPANTLGGSPDLFIVKNPTDLGVEDSYFTLNKLKKAQYAKNSFMDLLKNGIFKYDGGFFQYKNDRFLINEASSIYFLETLLGKLKGADQIIFDICFDYFKNLGKREGGSRSFISDLLPALGWGDMFLDGQRVVCISYPWTQYYQKTSFPFVRGMLSGLVSSFSGKDIRFNKVRSALSSDSLDLIIS